MQTSESVEQHDGSNWENPPAVHSFCWWQSTHQRSSKSRELLLLLKVSKKIICIVAVFLCLNVSSQMQAPVIGFSQRSKVTSWLKGLIDWMIQPKSDHRALTVQEYSTVCVASGGKSKFL